MVYSDSPPLPTSRAVLSLSTPTYTFALFTPASYAINLAPELSSISLQPRT